MNESSDSKGNNSKKVSNLDSSNKFAVGMLGGGAGLVVINNPCTAFTPEEAINLAAWLSVIADPSGEEVAKLAEEIKKT